MENSERKIYENIGVQLRYFRESKGLSLSQLAEILEEKFDVHFNPNALGKAERGEIRLLAHQLILISDFLKIPNEVFVNRPPSSDPVDTVTDAFQELLSDETTRKIIHFLVENRNRRDVIEILFEAFKYGLGKIDVLVKGARSEHNASTSLKAASPKKSRNRDK